jgi:hypothetical protein
MRTVETLMQGHAVRDPADGTESKQPQANQPADVIADHRHSQFMKFGCRARARARARGR